MSSFAIAKVGSHVSIARTLRAPIALASVQATRVDSALRYR
jgi:hypothetical protein